MDAFPTEPTEKVNFDVLTTTPLLFVVSGVSGVGKDTVVKKMQAMGYPFHFVVTTTDRAPRDGETQDVDYHFISSEEFQARVDDGKFLEHAVVYEQRKGVERHEFEKAIEANKDVIMRVDVQGARRMRRLFGDGAVLIFLAPTDHDEWVKRIVDRGADTEEQIQERIRQGREEMEQLDLFDYYVRNPDSHLERTVAEVINIIELEHKRVHHRRLRL